MASFAPVDTATIQAKLDRQHELNQAAEQSEERANFYAAETVRHLLTGFASMALQHARESQEERARAARLRIEAQEAGR